MTMNHWEVEKALRKMEQVKKEISVLINREGADVRDLTRLQEEYNFYKNQLLNEPNKSLVERLKKIFRK